MKRFYFAVLLGLLLAFGAPIQAQEPPAAEKPATIEKSKAAQKNAEADALFQRDKVWNVHLIVSAEEWKKIEPATPAGPQGFGPPPNLLNDNNQPGMRPNGPPRGGGFMNIDFPEVKATFEFEGQPVGEIGLRYKGNSTYASARNSIKKSFKVDFNQFVKKQKFYGQTKLNLNNNMLDPSMVRETLAYEVFRQAGVPAPRTSFARVYLTVTGEKEKQYLGLYTIVEQVDERFLRNYFSDDNGLLLKPQMVRGLPYYGEDWKSYTKPYEAKNDPPTAETQRFIALAKLVNEGSDEEFKNQIRTFINVNAFTRFLALNGLLVNMDSILAMGQNYYIYHDTTEDQFHWIPWDLNMSFGGFPAGTVDQMLKLSLNHPHAGENKLIDRLLAIPEIKAVYDQQLKESFGKAMQQDKLFAALDQIKAAVRPAIADESAQALEQFDRALSDKLEITPPSAAANQANQSAQPRRMGGPGFGGPGFGGPMGMGGAPLKAFIAQRIASIQNQLAGKETGFIPQSRGPMGGPMAGGGQRGFRPGGSAPPPGGPDVMMMFGGPTEMLAPALLDQADKNHDKSLSKAEIAAASKTWFAEWKDKTQTALTAENVGAMILKLMFPDGAPPLMGPAPEGMPRGGPHMFLAESFMRASDANKDQKLTGTEMESAFAKWFGEWDADKSNALSLQEWQAGMSKVLTPQNQFFGGEPEPAPSKTEQAKPQKSKVK